MEIRHAERTQAKIRLALQGPSGSGKTYSSLLLAYGLVSDWSKICVIDTENNSADLYAHLGRYNVLSLGKPFTPERYIEAIDTCEKSSIEVIIIDSITQEWDGAGGILEIHGNMTGNSFVNWNKVTPRHNSFIQKILQSGCHIIGTIRTKQDYVISDKNGKAVPEKVGLRGITREGVDYEFTVVLDLDLKHQATASKDRTGLFMDKPSFVIGNDTGLIIKNWCSDGIALDDVREKIMKSDSLTELRDLYNRYPSLNRQLMDDFTRRKEELMRVKESPIIE